MLGKLGTVGLLGVVLLLGGLGIVAWESPVVAGGIGVLLLGLLLVAYGLVTNLLSSLGMGGML